MLRKHTPIYKFKYIYLHIYMTKKGGREKEEREREMVGTTELPLAFLFSKTKSIFVVFVRKTRKIQ